MNKKLIFCISVVFITGFLSAQTLTIRVENIEIEKGNLMIGIFSDEENFPDNYFRGESIPTSYSVLIIRFENLPFGQYSVSVYQDANNNGKLDTNIFGIPTERYGFSNDIRRPDFRRSMFDFNGDMTITIRIR